MMKPSIRALAAQWERLVQDLSYSLRLLNRARGFAALVIALVAIGVGANTAAFSVADFVLFRPIPFPNPDALVRLCWGPQTGGGWGCMNQLSPANYRDYKEQTSSFSAMGAFYNGAVNLVGAGEPQRLQMAGVTSEVLPLLGVQPVLGRMFDTTDGGATREDAVILSYGLWQSQFGGDPQVLERRVNLNGTPYEVAGVMPREFYFPTREVQLWTSLILREEDFEDRNDNYLEAVARLRPGTTMEEARADLELVAERLRRDYPATNEGAGFSFFAMRDYMSPRARMMLYGLSGASLCILLLACAKLANLLLARAGARRRELAVRAALGAGRRRLVRHLVTESMTLTLLGGLAGLALARALLPLLTLMVPDTLPVSAHPTLDLRVLTLALAFTTLTGLGFALLPALRASGHVAFEVLREGGRTTGGRKLGLRHALVGLEVALSVILLITSGLLIRAAWSVQSVDPGFTPEGVMTVKTPLPRPKYDLTERRMQFFHQVLTDVRALPGVEAAAYITGLPMVMTGRITGITLPEQQAAPGAREEIASIRFVTPQYFETMGIPLLRGRDFTDADRGDREPVAVVSESFARRYWPDEDPIGRTFVARGGPRTVVGVVGDVRVRGLEVESEPQMYASAAQVTDAIGANDDPQDLVIRFAGTPDTLLPEVRRIVHAADPDQPLSQPRSLDQVLAGQTETRRAHVQVLGTLAGIALLLAAVGIYALLSYTVAQRSRELGVRLALGAAPRAVASLVAGQALRLTAIGLLPGLLVAWMVGRWMQALLFGVSPADLPTFALAVAMVLLATLVGALVPVWRAVRVNPMVLLRSE